MGGFSDIIPGIGIGNSGPSSSQSSSASNSNSGNTSDSNNYNDNSVDQVDQSVNTNASGGDAVAGDKITYSTDNGIVNAAGRVLESGMTTIGRALETGFQTQVATNDATGKALQGSFTSLTDALKSIAGVAGKAVDQSAGVANVAAAGLADVKGATGLASLAKFIPWAIAAVVAFLIVRKK